MFGFVLLTGRKAHFCQTIPKKVAFQFVLSPSDNPAAFARRKISPFLGSLAGGETIGWDRSFILQSDPVITTIAAHLASSL
jgi:hypothetical protein